MRDHPLVVVGGPDPLVQELVGNAARELRAAGERDEVQHQVEGGGAARARDALAVDLEQVGGDLESGKIFGQGLDVLPVDGAPVAIEHAGPGEQPGTGGKGPRSPPRGARTGEATRSPAGRPARGHRGPRTP